MPWTKVSYEDWIYASCMSLSMNIHVPASEENHFSRIREKPQIVTFTGTKD